MVNEAEVEAAKAIGSCKKAVVKVQPPMHIILFILNIVFSGWGTMISACMDKKLNGDALLYGILQWLFCWTVVCWIWSIVHGYWIFEKGSK